MKLPSKMVSVLCALQVFIVVFGYAVVHTTMKAFDKFYPAGKKHYFTGQIAPSDLTLYVREDGLWLVWVPVVWVLLAVWRSQATDGIAEVTGWLWGAGVVLTVGLGGVFVASMWNAIRATFGF